MKIIKYSMLTFGCLVIGYPLWVRFNNTAWSWDYHQILFSIFPFFGLLAFTLLWLHSISGAFEPWLRQYINFDWFVHITSIIILICLIAHPLLLVMGMDFNIKGIFFSYDAKYIWLAIIAWLLLITYDIGKVLKKHDFFAKNWNAILIISNIGFLLTFFHSLALGSDLQQGPLRIIWIFYGITAMLAIAYTYGVKKFLK